MADYTEDNLVQKTTADYLEKELGWESVYAYNQENFGTDSLLGRDNDRQVVLTRYLKMKLIEFNPGLPEHVYDSAVRIITDCNASQTGLAVNHEKYELLKNGVQVTFRDDEGKQRKERLKVFDFSNPENNHFLCVRELWIRGDLYRRRADIIGFVNGIPLLFMEVKNINKDVKAAYEKNLCDYRDTIPHIFNHNAFAILGNGTSAKIGAYCSKYEYFHEWKRLAEEEPGVVDMETLLKGVCCKRNFMDIFENFIIFDNSSGTSVKILARNHQFLGVNRALDAVRDRDNREGRLGVFWHTQGSGKSYSMVFFTRKTHRKLGGNFTFLICTDRDDLDSQIYKTFAGCALVDNDKDPCRAADGKHLKQLLREHKTHVFTLIQKFNKDVDPSEPYNERSDIIVITDEAHRSQYGRLALNLRNALPNASCIGFTGTPLFKNDEITKKIFGEYVSTYDFQRAVEDKATVPLYYDNRGEKLGISTEGLNEKIADKLEELEVDDIDVQQRLEQALSRDYHIITAESRLKQIAADFVQHYSIAWETGKAMFVCIDKLTCVKMHKLITEKWSERIKELEKKLSEAKDEQEEIYLKRQILWMKETQAAVVVSEEQGEVDKFRKWGMDIRPHRSLLKNGFNIPEHLKGRPEFSGMHRLDADSAFKEDEHPFRIAIVCAMWLTGFDVPNLATLYLDKPLKAHTLMQAIARANRIKEGKNNGMIVDYCGILKNLRKALATFAGQGDEGHRGGDTGADPARPKEELLDELAESISMIRSFLKDKGASLDDIIATTGFKRNAAILSAKEVVNENDKIRKHFEINCRAVFTKFKSCLNISGINNFRHEHDAINIIYKSLQQDKDKADISDIIRELHKIVESVVKPNVYEAREEPSKLYDISKINFEKLRQEFAKTPAKRTTVQSLKTIIETRLQKMLARNPLRVNYQKKYEDIISAYNAEKDRFNIEQTFELLLQLNEELTDEENRAVREGLDEENLAIFDLLKKPDILPADVKRIKKVATELLETLKTEKLKIDHWTDKESTRDAVRTTIHDFLFDDATGLPIDTYTDEDVSIKTEEVFAHVFRVYPFVPSPYYEEKVS